MLRIGAASAHCTSLQSKAACAFSCRFEHNIGHYTQMLWADTTLVGCGYTRYFSGGWWKELYTCNYGPAGNVLDQQMYAPGEACSRCPAGASCSKHYRGLCGEWEPSGRRWETHL